MILPWEEEAAWAVVLKKIRREQPQARIMLKCRGGALDAGLRVFSFRFSSY
jgi:hypothetical protein